MTPQNYITALRRPTVDNPLRILMSACLSGIRCGFDGSANGDYPSARQLLDYKTCKVTTFCPEEHSFGSPREMCDIDGGTGMDVLDGKAKVLSDSGKDWSAGMIKGAEKMLERAKENNIELAVMMDISAACGSTVIYSGNRFSENKVYQIGQGVAAALLMRNGITVISQRDYASLEALYAKLNAAHEIDTTKIDHRETDWYKSYFGK